MQDESAQTVGEPTAPPVVPRQVIVDAVIISTEEIEFSGKGVNLLSGLQLTFSYADVQASAALGRVAEAVGVSTGIGFSTFPFSRTVTRSLNIPAVTYSLNIFNSQYDRNEVLARPSLVAIDGLKSTFFSGAELSIGFSGTLAGGNVEKLKVGVTRAITPTFLSDDLIQLAVTVERDSFEQLVPGTFQQAVQTSLNNLTANVVLGFDQTLIISGLSEKETTRIDDRVPVLGDIPLLQYLFGRQTTLDVTKSVLFLLTPRRPAFANQARAQSPLSSAEPLAVPRAPPNVEELTASWDAPFEPAPNVDAVLYHLHGNALYRQFRTGDVTLEAWRDVDGLSRKINRALQFLYF